MNRTRLMALLLALVTLMLYLPVGWHDFTVYDDGDYVFQNKVVRAGVTWDGVKWAFDSWHSSNWHPLTWLSHMLDCQVFGLTAGAHHLVNVALHVANALLLFLLVFRLTKALWPAGVVAALFAWHPLHVESVAWVAERKDVLSTFFGLLAMLAYARYGQEKNRKSFWMAVALFACSLMSKPMLVTLPFVFLLLDVWPLGRVAGSVAGKVQKDSGVRLSALVFEKWPFFLLTVASCVVTFFAQRQHSVIPLVQYPLSLRLENVIVSYAQYLLKMIWPVDLAIIYPLPREIPVMLVGIAAAVLVVISIAVWNARKRAPYLLIGWLWFLGTLVPVIGLVQVGTASMADRYSYFPLVGIFIALVFGFRDLAQRWGIKPTGNALAAAAVLGACLVMTGHQLKYWENDEALFGHAVAVTKDNSAAEINYGVALQNAGQEEAAQTHFREALRIDPRFGEANVNIGIYLDKRGQTDEAMSYYQDALKIWPASPLAHMNLGQLYVKLGRFDEAIPHYEAAERFDETDARPHYLMGKLRLRQGRSAEAVTNFHDALKLDPMDEQSWLWLARVRAEDMDAANRNGQEAVEAASRANILSNGNDPVALDVLAMAFAEAGQFTQAQQAENLALQIAEASKMDDAVKAMQERMELYKSGKAYREVFKQP